ncbi:hypothetical protein YC2023_093532 [Brassica napus]
MILANLPHDLESEILARVPAKSLSQLKTTCKRWYALFNLMRIWVSNKVDEEGKELSWRKDFVLEVDFDKFQLPCEVNVASFLLNEEKKVAVFCETKATKGEEQTRIYIAGEAKCLVLERILSCKQNLIMDRVKKTIANQIQ